MQTMAKKLSDGGKIVTRNSKESPSLFREMGVSENSVPLNPMVNDHYPVFKWLFDWEYTLFSDKPKSF